MDITLLGLNGRILRRTTDTEKKAEEKHDQPGSFTNIHKSSQQLKIDSIKYTQERQEILANSFSFILKV